jgi:uncharacterized protein YidB (DUF937 family)
MNTQDILSAIKTQVGSSLDGSTLPSGVNSGSIADTAGESILASLQGQAQNGDVSNIMEMFSGSETAPDHPSIAGLSPDLVNQLSSKFGLDSGTANSIVSQILPGIMNTFNNKINSGNFDVSSIVGQFQNGNIGDVIQGFFSNQTDTNNNQNSASKSSGIFGILKGLFGK